MHEDKRTYPRKPYPRGIICYIDGQRFDADGNDISLGGMFIKTHDFREVPLDALVAVVVVEAFDPDATIFLFGRVTRHQEEPVEGLGLVWDRAVGTGIGDMLRDFLAEVFEIEAPVLRPGSPGRDRQPRFIYEFPNHSELQDHSSISGLYRTLASKSETDRHPGALTMLVKRAVARWPCVLGVSLEFENLKLFAVVRELGAVSMFIETSVAPLDVDSRVMVRLEIEMDGATTEVAIKCAVKGLSRGDGDLAPGLDLDIQSVDEGNKPGIFMHLVRSMCFSEMAME